MSLLSPTTSPLVLALLTTFFVASCALGTTSADHQACEGKCDSLDDGSHWQDGGAVADAIATDAAETCEGVKAVFFDLGETLVSSTGGRFELIPGVRELLGDLKEQSVRIGVITNTPAAWTRADLEVALNVPGLLEEFEVVLLSSEAMSSAKPAPAIFLEAHSLMADEPAVARVAFVTEELSHVQAAMGTGMVGIHLANESSGLTDFTVARSEIVTIADIARTACLE